jgi:hypothetical protein
MMIREHPLPRLHPDAGRERHPKLELADRFRAVARLADHAVAGEVDPQTAIAGIRGLLAAAETWSKAAA